MKLAIVLKGFIFIKAFHADFIFILRRVFDNCFVITVTGHMLLLADRRRLLTHLSWSQQVEGSLMGSIGVIKSWLLVACNPITSVGLPLQC